MLISAKVRRALTPLAPHPHSPSDALRQLVDQAASTIAAKATKRTIPSILEVELCWRTMSPSRLMLTPVATVRNHQDPDRADSEQVLSASTRASTWLITHGGRRLEGLRALDHQASRHHPPSRRGELRQLCLQLSA